MDTRRANFERGWILVSVAYGGLRAALVWKFLRKYGVNPYVFAGIEFTSAAIYGKSSATVVGAVIDGSWNRIWSWLPIALFAYFAPDAYVLLSAGRLPSDMLAILLTMVGVTLGLTGIGIAGQIRRAKRAHVVVE
ncbi:hypothetical protein GM51_0750 [freshwater metagenome]|uniref:Uncharacterized protein n=1 Tax=freshwater metagenome TaxID=449393 RepID=A0A094QE39_9ZZZZ